MNAKTKKAWQRLFDTFLDRVDGHGRCVGDDEECRYVIEGKPGCAIGCQPAIADNPDMRSKVQLLESGDALAVGTLISHIPKLGEELFGYEPNSEDMDFAMSLQSLHDCELNWNEDETCLLLDSVNFFANKHGLTVPPKYHS